MNYLTFDSFINDWNSDALIDLYNEERALLDTAYEFGSEREIDDQIKLIDEIESALMLMKLLNK